MHRLSVESSHRDLLRLAIERLEDRIDPDEWAMNCAQRDVNDRFSATIADSLESAPRGLVKNLFLGHRQVNREYDLGRVEPRRPGHNLSIVGLDSGKVREVESYQCINFIPSVAKRTRAGHLEHLEYTVWRHPEKFRSWTFIADKRVPVTRLRETCAKLHRGLSKIAKELRDEFGVNLVFRSTEQGTMKRYGAFCQGIATFHVHAHCLVETPRLGRSGYSRLLKKVHKRWRSLMHMSPDQRWSCFHDAGKVRDVREVCKYMVKAQSVLNLHVPELLIFYREVKGLHLVQMLGDMAKERRLMKDQGSRPIRTSDGWRIVQNWNKHSEAKKKAIRETKINGKIYRSTGSSKDVVLALTPPTFQFSPNVCEVSALVCDYSGRLQSLVETSVECYHLNGIYRAKRGGPPGPVGPSRPVPSKVHNDRITVRRKTGISAHARGSPHELTPT